ncbi:MAG TPA: magnesium/cobalt transporter CorA [Methanotrichaceae archaeon]|nr:magnesium/cobalt transporter CorA [Methanotrichaceae archaeon]
MARIFKIRTKKVGQPPGTLVHVGEARTEPVRITVLDYDLDQLQEFCVTSIDQCLDFKKKPSVTWINVVGVHRPKVIEKIGDCFDIHPLILEDILNTEQRPKIEDFDDYIFIVLKMLSSDDTDDGMEEIRSEQVSLIVGQGFVISFQETGGDVFDPVRDRIRKSKGKIRKTGADYLAYALIDAIVDNYFLILEDVGEDLEVLEEELVTNPSSDTSHQIHEMKRDMIFLRKSVWPLREVISRLSRGESEIFEESTEIYLRDVYDHTVQVIDAIETFRDILSGMLDIYLSSISNRMNEVMKVLTIIATIFIPLTLVAGIYGMNFDYMPELRWRWGYPAVLLFMLFTGFLMVLYFRRREWL